MKNNLILRVIIFASFWTFLVTTLLSVSSTQLVSAAVASEIDPLSDKGERAPRYQSTEVVGREDHQVPNDEFGWEERTRRLNAWCGGCCGYFRIFYRYTALGAVIATTILSSAAAIIEDPEKKAILGWVVFATGAVATAFKILDEFNKKELGDAYAKNELLIDKLLPPRTPSSAIRMMAITAARADVTPVEEEIQQLNDKRKKAKKSLIRKWIISDTGA